MTKTPPISPFAPEEWAKKDFEERLHVASHVYVLDGMNYPLLAYVFHAVKVVALFLAWVFFVSFTPGIGSLSNIGDWIFHPVAFQKAFLWGCFFEAAGMGCMSGPLGLKIWPPFTAFLHLLRPGTTKLAAFPGAPVIGGTTRTPLDVALYAAYLGSLLYALIQPELSTAVLLGPVLLLPLCALGDRMIPLAARSEHHWAMVVCFLLLGQEFLAGAKWVQLAVWFWAGVSKLTVAFTYVVPIMTANNPMLKSQWFRRKLFVDFPEDLSPSLLAKCMAHAGTFLEFATPITLAFVVGDGPLLYLGIFFMIALHGFIISNMPIAAVFEWNILSLYAGFFLFWAHPEVSLFAIDSPLLVAFLLVSCLVLPALGNLFPRRVSFLTAMRYYAGNWAWNAWLFKPSAVEKLHQLKRAAPLLCEQQRKFMSPEEATQGDAGFLAFRAMHLQGRMLGLMLPKLLGKHGRFQDYVYADGETVAGSVLGWNFGEGHLNDESLLDAIRSQVDFEEGEVRLLAVEAQPILGRTLHWRVVDGKTGPIDEGHTHLDELKPRKPWDRGPLPKPA